MAGFFGKLMEVRAERTTSGVTRGQANLIESPRKVREWQETTQAKLNLFHERINPTRELIEANLHEVFPDWKSLPA